MGKDQRGSHADPELLSNGYLPQKKYQTYFEVKQLVELGRDSKSPKELRKKATATGLKSCIETTEELAGHRVLMGYADVALDLAKFLDYTNGVG